MYLNKLITIPLRFLVLYLLLALPLFSQSQSKIEYVKLKDVKVKSFNLNNVELSGRLVLYNHLRLAAKIKSIQVDVFVDGEHIGTIYDSYINTLRKRQATDIPLELNGKLKSNFSRFFNSGGNLIRGQTIKIEYKGQIKVKALGIINKRLYFEDDLYMKLSDFM